MVSRSKHNIRINDAIEAYLERITNEGQSPATIRGTRYGLERFHRWLGKPSDPNPWVHSVTPKMIDQYCFGPEGIRRNVQAISFNRYRSQLKSFFEYAITMYWTDINPVDGLPPARPDMPKVKLMLSAGEMLALLEVASNPVERIALSLAMNTGLRANDIRQLTVFEASLQTGTIQTQIRKTRKLDTKPISLDLRRDLIRWLDTYAELTKLPSRGELPNEWLLVPTYRNVMRNERDQTYPIADLRPLSPHVHPYRLVQRPLRKLGYPCKGEGFHTLRRSSARALFESLRESGEGRDHALMIVKDFLNHASVSQTEHYLGLNQERAIRDALIKDQPFLTRLASVEQARVTETPGIRRGA